MKRSTLVRRGLGFYRRTHLGVIAGCAISAAVLVGALLVGDSVRGSLERLALVRLGRIHLALDAGTRFFRDGLAGRLQAGLKTDVAPVLRLPGMALRDASAGGPRSQVNQVEVLGVDSRFFLFAPAQAPLRIPPGQAALNEKLASALGVRVGDEVALRIQKPGLLSREAPLASLAEKDTRRSLVTVVAVLSDDQMGRFSLKSDQTGPYGAWVDLGWLQEAIDLPHKANLILAGETHLDAQEWLRSAWTLEDLGLSLREIDARGVIQLQSERIYLDPAVAGPALGLRTDAAGVLYYLVNSLRSPSGTSTPYSFVAAVSPSSDTTIGPVPIGMKNDEILINRWTADQLSVHEGDSLELIYSEVGRSAGYVEQRRAFRIRGVLGMEALSGERELVPDFPGLTDADNCRNWKLGIPTQEEQLKDPANEAYWKRFRQTPKAFVTLEAGRQMWASRYGDLMAVRYPARSTHPAEVRGQLRERIDVGQTGLVFRPVRETALKAASESMDLGQLFLGMSIFLVAASLTLTGMFFVFTVEQRAEEMGVLAAVGFTPREVRRLFLAEGAVLAGLGSVAGIPLGWGFAKALIWGLGSAWSGVVSHAAIEFHGRAQTPVIGAAAAAAISMIAMTLALRRQAHRPVRELVSEDFSLSLERRAARPGGGRIRRAVFFLSAAGAAAITVAALVGKLSNPAGAFFAAGGLLLVAGLAGFRMALGGVSRRDSRRLSIRELGIRNAARRPGRSLATAGMLACGSFMVFSVSAMKEDLGAQAGERHSGTGGFRLYAESSIPIPQDLNDARVRKELRLADPGTMEGVSFVPLRVHEGDDASCLNLNLSLAPPLLGVDPGRLAALGAFAGADLWGLLDRPEPAGVVPALVGDSDTAMWKLKKKVDPADGDLLDYRDEQGRPFKVKLVGALPTRLSVLQGKLLVSSAQFGRLYPSEGGFRVFLIDVPAGTEDRVIRYLSERLETAGLDVVRSVERLKEFYVVESSYLGMFMVLGGLGLLLGTAGMGVLVLRNVLERRGELALLRAVGYTRRQAASVVMAEHLYLLAAGLLAGTVASGLALGPGAVHPHSPIPYALLGGFLFGTAGLSWAWIRAATAFALRSPVVPALRHE